MRPPIPPGILPGGRVHDWDPAPPAYVVCDVDGTLVGPQPDATTEVVAAMRRATAAGLRVGIATGRMPGAVTALSAQLGITGPNIVHNGAEVRDADDRVAVWSLTPDQVDGLLAVAAADEDGYVEVYTDTGYHVSAWDERARPHWDILASEPVGVLRRAAELNGAVVPKATFALFDPADAERVTAGITELGLLPGPAGSPRTPTLTYVNATHPEADKGRALQVATAHLGFDLRATVAIGDAANDLSMLAVAGTAIAMGQAPPAVREAAHLVVPDVDAHGVAVALDACVGWLKRP